LQKNKRNGKMATSKTTNLKRRNMDNKELSKLVKTAIVAAGSKGKFLSEIQKEFRAKGIKARDRAFRAARDILVKADEVKRSNNGLLVAKQFAVATTMAAKAAVAKPKKAAAPAKKVCDCTKVFTRHMTFEAIDDFIDGAFDEVAKIVEIVSQDIDAGVEPCACPTSYLSKALELAVESGILAKHVIYTSPKFGKATKK